MYVSAAFLVGLFLVVSPGLSFPEKDIPNVEPEYLDMLLETKQYKLFSKLMKIDDVNRVRPSEKERSTNPMFNKGLKLGDIISKTEMEEARQSIDFDKYKARKWENNVVPYEISTKYTTTQKTKIEDGIKRWNEHLSPCIKFVPRNRQSDYVFFFSGEGCSSVLGRNGGQQPISLQPNVCLLRGTVIHEMAHAVGFTHEHNRLDRDTYIHMKWDNIPEEWRGSYKINDNRYYIDVAGYDYYSVMHYPIPSPGTNKPAFAVRQRGIRENEIGTADDFTPTDVEKIRSQYC